MGRQEEGLRNEGEKQNNKSKRRARYGKTGRGYCGMRTKNKPARRSRLAERRPARAPHQKKNPRAGQGSQNAGRSRRRIEEEKPASRSGLAERRPNPPAGQGSQNAGRSGRRINNKTREPVRARRTQAGQGAASRRKREEEVATREVIREKKGDKGRDEGGETMRVGGKKEWGNGVCLASISGLGSHAQTFHAT
ncbi:hypothetical protein C8R44DRAFT_736186 [Mycena epipterygia]|nr:hypothetical protein C8R44DRAFT_736186 [Mycena epipterygia]